MWQGVSIFMAAMCLGLLLFWLGSPFARFGLAAGRQRPFALELVWPWVKAIVPFCSRFMTWNLRRRLAHLLRQAGVDYFGSPQEFFALQWVLGSAAGGLVAFLLTGLLKFSLLIPGMAVAALLASMWPVHILLRLTQQRKRAMLRAFPFLLDMVSLCVEAGLNLQGALRQVADKGPEGPLRDEIRHLLADIRAGSTRQEALLAWAQRCDLMQVQQFVATVLQAEVSGMSLGPALRAHADQWRSERFLQAEKQALEAPVKLMFPLVFCIFPCSFLIIAFPLAQQFLEFLK